jgi:hypothetical protein
MLLSVQHLIRTLPCFQIHKNVSLSRHRKFAAWVQSWVDKSATRANIDVCTDFLLGRGAGSAELVPCRTEEQVIADENSSPYYAYRRYRVTYTATKETPKKL